MTPYEILTRAGQLVNDRGKDYGDIEENFIRAAKIASLKLNMDVSPYVVATVMESVKDSRLAPKRKEDMTNDELISGVEEIARKFAPRAQQNNPDA